MLFDIAMFSMLTMCTFAGCILMKPFYIMGVRNIGLNKLTTLRDTFIFMFVSVASQRLVE